MLEDLKIEAQYAGFAFLADTRTLPRLRPHRHVELEFNLVERGSITYVVDGRRFRFPKRTLLWLFSAQEHQLVDRTDDARYYVAVFKPDLIRNACTEPKYASLARGAPEDPARVLHAELPPESFDLLRRTIDSVLEDGLNPDLLSREAGFGVTAGFHYEHHDPNWLNAGLRLLLLHGWRLQRALTGATRAVRLHTAVRQALALLSDEVEPGDLRELARRCGVSDAHLSRTFARQVGVPISRYRNALRLRRFWDACHRTPAPNLTDAAYSAGFGSYAQFFKVFHSAYGCGPRDCIGSDRAESLS
jgi:AraC-like DNA-binding protein